MWWSYASVLYNVDVIIEIPLAMLGFFKCGGGKDAIKIDQDGEILG